MVDKKSRFARDLPPSMVRYGYLPATRPNQTTREALSEWNVETPSVTDCPL